MGADNFMALGHSSKNSSPPAAIQPLQTRLREKNFESDQFLRGGVRAGKARRVPHVSRPNWRPKLPEWLVSPVYESVVARRGRGCRSPAVVHSPPPPLRRRLIAPDASPSVGYHLSRVLVRFDTRPFCPDLAPLILRGLDPTTASSQISDVIPPL